MYPAVIECLTPVPGVVSQALAETVLQLYTFVIADAHFGWEDFHEWDL